MITSKNTEKLTEEGKFPLAVWRKSVGSNSILCQFCRCQVKDVKVLGKLSKSKFKCQKCENQLEDKPEIVQVWN